MRTLKRLAIVGLLLPISQIFAGWYASNNGDIGDGYEGYSNTSISEYGEMASCEAAYGFSWPYQSTAWFSYSVILMHNVNGDEGWSGQVYGGGAVASTYGAKYSGAYSYLGCFVDDIYGYVYAEALQ